MGGRVLRPHVDGHINGVEGIDGGCAFLGSDGHAPPPIHATILDWGFWILDSGRTSATGLTIEYRKSKIQNPESKIIRT